MNSKDVKENQVNKSFENVIYIQPTEKQREKIIPKKEKKIKDIKKEEIKKQTYPQQWESYNKAQTREKILLMNLLDELLNYIDFPKITKIGRNPISIRDKIFYTIIQSYNEKSSRRCISDLEIAKRFGFVEKTIHFNTLLKCMRDESLIKYFKHLINVSGIPLQQIENDFAVDSSGFSTSHFGRWLDVRAGTHLEKRKFVKAHVTCGVKTNIITSVNITKGFDSDCVQFESLVKETDKIYDIREVSADKAYISKNNLQVVHDLGGIPFIPFKKNVRKKPKGDNIWKTMYLYYTNNQEEFYNHYHKRSNSETTFHMIKRKFGSHLRNKSEVGQVNELLAKCLCHNLCVLIQEAFEIGIELNFKKCAKYPIAHN